VIVGSDVLRILLLASAVGSSGGYTCTACPGRALSRRNDHSVDTVSHNSI